tara:strand:- start:1133 stop:1330 length:198 start_codon:yes stop_codon:yes gene_type:complete
VVIEEIMCNPSLGKKTAIFINIFLIFLLVFGILVKTASINKPDIKKNIPMPKEEDEIRGFSDILK